MKNNILIIVILIIIVSCSKEEKIEEPQILPLVKIGDITISKDEFIRRAEYTIRPNYCKNNYNIHKKIILNSIIAEKLFALEADNDTIFQKSEFLDNYVTGRRNQAMRQFHYYNEATQKVELDNDEITNIFNKAGKKYQLVFLNMPDMKMANEFLTLLKKENLSFQAGIKEFTGNEKLPLKEITYDNVQNAEIHNILFNSKIDKKRIYGPIKTLSGNGILFQVLTWTDSKVITDEQIKLRHNDVKEKVKRIKSDKIYESYVLKLMKGKRLDFNRDTFIRLATLYSELYSIKTKNNKKLMNKELWGKDQELIEVDSLQQKFQNLKDAIIFSLDDVDWTVEKFQEELQIHPLVFRKDDISASEFPIQFRFAIADLIRDKYITEDAYKKGYDNLNTVKNYTAMWKDNAVSQYYRDKYLFENKFDENFNENYLKAIHEYLNPLVDSLQLKYSDMIFIDTEIFNKIKLTRIDLFAIQSNVPYPIVVPSFPVITDDSKLDYGKKMQE